MWTRLKELYTWNWNWKLKLKVQLYSIHETKDKTESWNCKWNIKKSHVLIDGSMPTEDRVNDAGKPSNCVRTLTKVRKNQTFSWGLRSQVILISANKLLGIAAIQWCLAVFALCL